MYEEQALGIASQYTLNENTCSSQESPSSST